MTSHRLSEIHEGFPIHIELFGGLRLWSGDVVPVEFAPQQAGLLLACLALQHPGRSTRDELICLLWPEDDTEEGRHKLRQCLYTLRRQLAAFPDASELLIASRTHVYLQEERVTTDVARFRRLLETARQASDPSERAVLLSEACAPVQGELLPGFYNDLIVSERERLAETHRFALRDLTLAFEAQGLPEKAVECARRLTLLDPLMEEAHGDLIRLYIALGQPSAARRQYQELEKALRESLGQRPSVELDALFATLRDTPAVPAMPRSVVPTPPAAYAVPVLLPSVTAKSDSSPEAHNTKPARRRTAVRTLAALATLAILVLSLLKAALPTKRSEAHAAVNSLTAAHAMLWRIVLPVHPGDGDSEPTALTTDPAGNIYVTGFVQTRAHDVDFFTVKYSPDGRLLWEARYNGPANDVDRARSIALGKDGSVYVTGDSDNGKGRGETRLSGLDFATLKYTPDGKPSPTWPDVGFGVGVRRYNGPADGEDTPRTVVTDADYVYVAGTSWGGVLSAGRLQGTQYDYAVVAYTPDGHTHWTKRIDGGAHLNDTMSDMALTPFGGLAITGSSLGGSKLGSDVDYLTLLINAGGNLEWMVRYAGPSGGNDEAHFLRVDAGGNVYVSGNSYGGDPGNGGTDTDVLTVKYDPNGAQLWTHRIDNGVHTVNRVNALWVTPTGEAAVAYDAQDQAGYPDMAVVKYASVGRFLWSRSYNGAGCRMDQAKSVVADAKGGVYVAGYTFSHPPTAINQFFTGATLLQYTSEGTLIARQEQVPTDHSEAVFFLTLDASGAPVGVGRTGDGKRWDTLLVKYRP